MEDLKTKPVMMKFYPDGSYNMVYYGVEEPWNLAILNCKSKYVGSLAYKQFYG